jgi:hypothetical protein
MINFKYKGRPPVAPFSLFGAEKEDIAFENSYMWNVNP